MSATTTSTTEGTSPVVASPAATPPPATPAQLPQFETAHDFEKALAGANLSAADLDALMTTPDAKPREAYSGSLPAEPSGTTPPPAPVTPAQPEAQKPAEVADAPKPEAAADKGTEAEDPQPEKLGRFRLQARDFKHAEFLRLQKTLPVEEAYAKVYGTPKASEPAPTKPSEAAAPQSAPVESKAVTDAKASLAKLEADLDKATEDADVGAVAKIMRDISKAERAIERAEADSAAAAKAAESTKAAEAQNTFRQRESAATQEIVSVFPKLGDPASPERAEFQQFINLKYDDPDYGAIFASPLWPKVLGREFAEAKGWNKAPAPAPAQSTPAPTPGAAPAPRVTAAEVLTPGATQGGANITAETLLRDLSKMTPKELDAIMAGAGGSLF